MRVMSGLMVVLGAMVLASCGLPQPIDPVYKLPVGKRVLVFVDPRANQNLPPEFSSELAEKISNLIYQYHGAERMVAQARVMELRREPEKLVGMSVADVAKAADADVVVHVDLIMMQVQTLSDESMTQGGAQALLKVVDRDGRRLWPAEAQAGAVVTASVTPGFTEQRTRALVQKEMQDQLAARIARAFVKYNAGEPALSK